MGGRRGGEIVRTDCELHQDSRLLYLQTLNLGMNRLLACAYLHCISCRLQFWGLKSVCPLFEKAVPSKDSMPQAFLAVFIPCMWFSHGDKTGLSYQLASLVSFAFLIVTRSQLHPMTRTHGVSVETRSSYRRCWGPGRCRENVGTGMKWSCDCAGPGWKEWTWPASFSPLLTVWYKGMQINCKDWRKTNIK